MALVLQCRKNLIAKRILQDISESKNTKKIEVEKDSTKNTNMTL